MNSVPPVADCQLSVTGRPETHAGQGMASQSRQRDIDTISFGRFGGIHRQKFPLRSNQIGDLPEIPRI